MPEREGGAPVQGRMISKDEADRPTGKVAALTRAGAGRRIYLKRRDGNGSTTPPCGRATIAGPAGDPDRGSNSNRTVHDNATQGCVVSWAPDEGKRRNTRDDEESASVKREEGSRTPG